MVGGAVRQELGLAGYAFGNFGKNLVWSAADVSLLFLLTDLLGMTPVFAGGLLFVAMMVDIAGDMLVGALSARAGSSSRIYRRMLFIGAPACALAFALLYALPAFPGPGTATVVLAVLAFRASYSLIDVPHNILLGHVSDKSRERGRAAGYRFFFSSTATLCVAWALTPIVSSRTHDGVLLFHLAIVGGGLFWLAMLIAWLSVRDGSRVPARASVPIASPGIVLKPFVRQFYGLAIVAFLTGFALPMFSRTLIYRGVYLENEAGYASEVLALLTSGQLVGVVGWTWLLRSQEKATLLAWSHLVTAGALAADYFVDSGGGDRLFVPVVGMGLAGVFMLPWAILVDVVDLEQWRNRRRREATMFTMFLVLLKIGAALSSVAIGSALDASGFVAGRLQSGETRAVISWLGYGMPIVAALVCAGLAARMPLTHRKHALVVERLQRSQAVSGNDPVRLAE